VGSVEASHREVRADGPRGRLAEAEPDVVDDELAVDRVRDRLADLLIVEGRPLRVEVELDDGGLHLVPARRRLDVRELRERLDVAVGDGAEAAHVRLALLDRRGARRGVRDEARDDAVEAGPALLPAGGVAVDATAL